MVNNAVTKLEKLNLVDKFLFDAVMEDAEVYRIAVSILLENEIEFLEKTETEKELRVSPQLRQIRLDVFSMDRKGKIYYTEMQKRNTGNLRRRSRYYQAQLDVSLLEPGSADFNLLNDSCLVLIAPFDIFGRGLYRYTFEGTCRECPDLSLEDGAARVFINTKGRNREAFSQEFLDFMEYITESTDEVARKTESARIKQLHGNVRKIKASEKMGVKYMQTWEELVYARQDGREEGREEGRQVGQREGEVRKLVKLVCKKMAKNKTIERIADELEEEESGIQPIYEAALKFAPEYDYEKVYEAYSKSYCQPSEKLEMI